MIVVGADHAGKDRAHEYLPYILCRQSRMDLSAGKQFPDFLTRSDAAGGCAYERCRAAEYGYRRIFLRRVVTLYALLRNRTASP
jgi:hypothetical protein